MQTSRIFHLPILSESSREVFAFFTQLLTAPKSSNEHKTTVIFTPNPEQVVLAASDDAFAQNLAQADYLLPDGIGLVIASAVMHFFGQVERSIPERITGVALVEHLLAVAKKQGQTALIIGGRGYGDKQKQTSASMSLKPIELEKGVFWTEAFQDKTAVSREEEQALAKSITQLKPKLVFVALGAPHQEEWIIKHRDLLQKNQVVIAMSVGGSFDFLFDKVARAPLMMQKLGLEWFWRLLKQPWRLSRQLKLIKFKMMTLREIVR